VAVVVRGDEFVHHLGEFNFGFVLEGCLVVEYLVLWDDAVPGHLHKYARAGENEFALAVILECLAPGVVEDHDVAIAKAGGKRELAIWSVYSVSLKLMIWIWMLCATMCAVSRGTVTGTVMLGGFASLVATGALMGQVDWTPWCYPCM
jgi:hypothetical protein